MAETAAHFVVSMLLLPRELLLLITLFYKGGNEDSEVKKVTCSEPHSPQRLDLGVKPLYPHSSILPPSPVPCPWYPANHGRVHPTAGQETPRHGHSTEKNKTVDVLRGLKIEFRNAECAWGKQGCVQSGEGSWWQGWGWRCQRK